MAVVEFPSSTRRSGAVPVSLSFGGWLLVVVVAAFVAAGIAIASMTMMSGGDSSPRMPGDDWPRAGENTAPIPEARLPRLSGSIRIDGSSTVYPISLSAAEAFAPDHPHVDFTVSFSGTGGGFRKFCLGETQINDASRPIKPRESERCEDAGIAYVELPIAFDGIGIYVNPQNDWCDHLTIDELRKIWEPGSRITNWNQVRAGFPDEPLVLYGPNADSGTFDYFTEFVNGGTGATRNDYTKSEDDNALVAGVAGNKGSLGYFGLAYYEANKDRLKALGLDAGAGHGPVKPSVETVGGGTYPLSRPLFIYVSLRALETQPAVAAFARFYVANAAGHARRVGYVPLPPELIELVQQRLDERVTGSMFANGAGEGASLGDLLRGR